MNGEEARRPYVPRAEAPRKHGALATHARKLGAHDQRGFQTLLSGRRRDIRPAE